MVVLAKESPTTPAVTLHASFQAGTIFDPPSHAGLAHFVSRTIDRGTETRRADHIAEELDSRGVSLSITVNRHAMALVCTCLVEDLSPMLALLADIAMHPTFPAEEVETKRGEIMTLIRQDEDNPAAMANEGLLAGSLWRERTPTAAGRGARLRASKRSIARRCGDSTPSASARRAVARDGG